MYNKDIILKCKKSIYIDDHFTRNNYLDKEFMFVGKIYKTMTKFINYKSILEFECLNIIEDELDKIELALSIDNLNFDNVRGTTIKITSVLNIKDIENINWSIINNIDGSNSVFHKITTEDKGKNIKIDVTRIIKNIKDFRNFILIIETLNYNHTSIIKFNSVFSRKPPFIKIMLNGAYSDDIDNNKDPIEEIENTLGETEIKRPNIQVKEKFEIDNSKLEEMLKGNLEKSSTSFDEISTKVEELSKEFDKKLEDLRNEMYQNNSRLESIYEIVEQTSSTIGSIMNTQDTAKLERILTKVNANIERLSALLKNVTIEKL